MSWFGFDGHSFEAFNSEGEARAYAEQAMDDWADDAGDGGWDELSTQVCFGKITHSVVATEQVVTEGRETQVCEEHSLEPIIERSTETEPSKGGWVSVAAGFVK